MLWYSMHWIAVVELHEEVHNEQAEEQESTSLAPFFFVYFTKYSNFCLNSSTDFKPDALANFCNMS